MSEPTEQWREQAYPLKQVTIQLQGTGKSSNESMIWLLEKVLERLRAGEVTGHEHDDDFGYCFETVSSDGPSFFNTPCGYK